jgi:hypothetical protein
MKQLGRSICVGTKDEKRKKKRDKLVEQLNQKREAQQLAMRPPPPPVSMGREMDEMLAMIQTNQIEPAHHADRSDPRIAKQQIIDRMKDAYSDASFIYNPLGAYDVARGQIEDKALQFAVQNAPPRPA